VSHSPVFFDGVWKKFHRGERHDSLRDLIPAAARRFARRNSSDELTSDEFWALRDVSFTVQPGEALGIIGPNGAGKSTTLKLLTKILRPTRGRRELRGRVGALIEIAAGFHPDLTGRENVYLQGAIMGMRRMEVARKLDGIVDFAGLADFIDTPIKRYSSGMNARLGFSIAAHVEPEVLLIDEVLAVGDLEFQERCFERLRQFKRSGVALVLVSHNLAAVSSLCDSTLVLRRGEVCAFGDTPSGIAAYASLATIRPDAGEARPATEVVVEIRDVLGGQTQQVNSGDQFVIVAHAQISRHEADLVSGIRIRRVDTGEAIWFSRSEAAGCEPIAVEPLTSFCTHWAMTANLARGHYSVEVVLFDARTERIIARVSPAGYFVVDGGQTVAGVAYMNARCSMSVSEEALA
jgi:ABC-type polysaccharide/polyol phosphate transport system ATPase subunit